MNLKYIIILLSYFLSLNCCSPRIDHSNTLEGKMINNFNHPESEVNFTYTIKEKLLLGGTHKVNCKIKNNSTKRIILLGSRCIEETGIYNIENNPCELTPFLVCGYISAEYQIVEPDAYYAFSILLNCEQAMDEMDIQFELIQPTTLFFNINSNQLIDIRKSPKKYTSRMLQGVKESSSQNSKIKNRIISRYF